MTVRVVLGEPPRDPPGDEPVRVRQQLVARCKRKRPPVRIRLQCHLRRRWSTASTIALDSGRAPGRGPLSKRLIAAVLVQARVVLEGEVRPLPIEKSLRLPPSRQRIFPVRGRSCRARRVAGGDEQVAVAPTRCVDVKVVERRAELVAHGLGDVDVVEAAPLPQQMPARHGQLLDHAAVHEAVARAAHRGQIRRAGLVGGDEQRAVLGQQDLVEVGTAMPAERTARARDTTVHMT